MRGWRAFYADGRRLTSAGCRWRELPSGGLVVAVWWDDRGVRHLECGADALMLAGDAIVSVNLPTATFERVAELEAALGFLKYGERMEPDAWAAVRAEADDAREPPG